MSLTLAGMSFEPLGRMLLTLAGMSFEPLGRMLLSLATMSFEPLGRMLLTLDGMLLVSKCVCCSSQAEYVGEPSSNTVHLDSLPFFFSFTTWHLL